MCNFVPHSGLRKICFGVSIVETCYQLSSRKADAQSVINWAVVGQLSQQYLGALMLNHYSLLQVIVELRLQRDSCTGQLVTVGTCLK